MSPSPSGRFEGREEGPILVGLLTLGSEPPPGAWARPTPRPSVPTVLRCQRESMNRWKDWWDQGERDARHARHALEDADHEWSAFAAQQAAEKVLKALIMSQGGEP